MPFATNYSNRLQRDPFKDLAPTPPLSVREGQRVKVRVLKPFYVGGIRQDVGTELLLTEFDALSLKARGRAEIA